MLEHFVWEAKSPRCNRYVLQQTQMEGGLAFPNLWQYYLASLLESIIPVVELIEPGHLENRTAIGWFPFKGMMLISY